MIYIRKIDNKERKKLKKQLQAEIAAAAEGS
jgi:hypothetical protein